MRICAQPDPTPPAARTPAVSQEWFRYLQPWVDIQFAQSTLFVFEGPLGGEQWANIGVTGVIWLVNPLMVGLRFVLRSEVK